MLFSIAQTLVCPKSYYFILQIIFLRCINDFISLNELGKINIEFFFMSYNRKKFSVYLRCSLLNIFSTNHKIFFFGELKLRQRTKTNSPQYNAFEKLSFFEQ